MIELRAQQCSEIPGGSPSLNNEDIQRYLGQLDPRWQLDANAKKISYCYSFKNYYQTIAFANVIAQIAHQQDHHPELILGYNRCEVNYSTHSIDGLSLNDFICAAKINAAQNL